MYQTTLAESFTFNGVGLHSGRQMVVNVLPAKTDSGYQFRRSDVKNCPYVKVTPYNVTSTQLATTVSCGDFPISTVEHLLSALYGLGIDNVLIDVVGAEIPILDGSAEPIAEMIDQVGVEVQADKRKYLKIKKEFIVEQDDKNVRCLPSESFNVSFQIDYSHKAIPKQTLSMKMTPDDYYRDISYARTFGFKKDVENLRKMGLAKGGSILNAIVLDEDLGVLNPGGLRNKDEFASHKILDLMGDISLIGYRILGDIHAVRSGHQVNNIFARKLLDSVSSYELVELTAAEKGYGFIHSYEKLVAGGS